MLGSNGMGKDTLEGPRFVAKQHSCLTFMLHPELKCGSTSMTDYDAHMQLNSTADVEIQIPVYE